MDFLANPALVDAAMGLLKRLANLQSGSPLLGKRQRNLLLETADHLAELDLFVQVVEDLHGALTSAQLQSDALRKVQQNLAAVVADPNFQALQAELPELRGPSRSHHQHHGRHQPRRRTATGVGGAAEHQ